MRIVVVGGGIAGLSAAHRLRELSPTVEIVVVDGAGQLGGKLRTGQLAGRSVELGAEMFLMRERGEPSAALRLAQRLGLGDELVHPASVPAAVALGDDRAGDGLAGSGLAEGGLAGGGLVAIPAGTLLGVPGDMSAVAGFGVDPAADRDEGRPLLRPGEDVAVGQLVRARLGDQVVERLVEPMLGGVYAGRADMLSLAATMPGLHAAAQRRTTLAAAVREALAASPRPAVEPVFGTVAGGLSRLVAVLAAAADARVRLGLPARALARTQAGFHVVVGSAGSNPTAGLDADGVVLAVPAPPAARLLAGVVPDAAAAVAVLDYASVALVTLVLPGVALPALSGLLVPPGRGFAVKAVTFRSRKWPHLPDRDDGALVRASVGRHGEPADLQRPDGELAERVRRDVGELLGRALPAPVASVVTRWGGALPQYAVGHLDRVVAVRSALPPGLALAGAAFDGVGIAACVRSGEAAAESVWGHLRQLPP